MGLISSCSISENENYNDRYKSKIKNIETLSSSSVDLFNKDGTEWNGKAKIDLKFLDENRIVKFSMDSESIDSYSFICFIYALEKLIGECEKQISEKEFYFFELELNYLFYKNVEIKGEFTANKEGLIEFMNHVDDLLLPFFEEADIINEDTKEYNIEKLTKFLENEIDRLYK